MLTRNQIIARAAVLIALNLCLGAVEVSRWPSDNSAVGSDAIGVWYLMFEEPVQLVDPDGFVFRINGQVQEVDLHYSQYPVDDAQGRGRPARVLCIRIDELTTPTPGDVWSLSCAAGSLRLAQSDDPLPAIDAADWECLVSDEPGSMRPYPVIWQDTTVEQYGTSVFDADAIAGSDDSILVMDSLPVGGVLEHVAQGVVSAGASFPVADILDGQLRYLHSEAQVQVDGFTAHFEHDGDASPVLWYGITVGEVGDQAFGIHLDSSDLLYRERATRDDTVSEIRPFADIGFQGDAIETLDFADGSATIQFKQAAQAGDELLITDPPPWAQVDYQADQARLHIGFAAPDSLGHHQIEQLLSTVRYRNASRRLTAGSRELRLIVETGDRESNAAVRRIDYVVTDSPPEDIALSRSPGLRIVLSAMQPWYVDQLSARDPEADDGSAGLQWRLGDASQIQGEMELSPEGHLQYRPDPQMRVIATTSQESIPLIVQDASGATAEVTLQIIISPPIAPDLPYLHSDKPMAASTLPATWPMTLMADIPAAELQVRLEALGPDLPIPAGLRVAFDPEAGWYLQYDGGANSSLLRFGMRMVDETNATAGFIPFMLAVPHERQADG